MLAALAELINIFMKSSDEFLLLKIFGVGNSRFMTIQ